MTQQIFGAIMPATNHPLPPAGAIPLQIGGRIYRPVLNTTTFNGYSMLANQILTPLSSNAPYPTDTVEQPRLILQSFPYTSLQTSSLSTLNTSTSTTNASQPVVVTGNKPTPPVQQGGRGRKPIPAAQPAGRRGKRPSAPLQPRSSSALSTSTSTAKTPQTVVVTGNKPTPPVRKKGKRLTGSGPGRKRKDTSTFFCYHCGTKETPEWRRGPTGPNTLCNACGLQYAKSVKAAKTVTTPRTGIDFLLNKAT